MMSRTFTAYIERDEETGLYVGTIPGLVGGHSQGANLEELRENLREVIELILEEKEAQGDSVELGTFVGIEQITVPE
jgi:predicted RNase H-like HicB family nuclease